ncbi:MAG: hypothetical protein A2X12_09925 [Bacteroidetes bacterium GWE2_29_8]|nr:MAG: hypothetical protein A2X12_09925 [Bacteroidetes bacterium GWE2_29_8]HBY21325.1 hypothetical protein [Clostridiales bacterium]
MKKNILFWVLVVVSFIGVLITYSNHFDNEFHFDDFHTICGNPFVRSLENIPDFFTDATTFSTQPANQVYRPLVTTTLAFDYWLGNGYNVFYFHLSMFIVYLLQCVLMFFLFRWLFDYAYKSKLNKYIALFGVSWYAMHTANAETINYIISRSDSYSAFAIILSVVIFIFFRGNKWQILYVFPLIFGILIKEVTVTLVPILFFYIYLFEKDLSFNDLFKSSGKKGIVSSLIALFPSILIVILMVVFTTSMISETFIPGGTSRYSYLITQPFVIFHYFGTFFFPLNLTADTDWKVLTSIFDDRFYAGILFLVGLIYIIYKTSLSKETKPISFGLIWFLVALLPTSSVIPLAEVMNDHRIFFPFVGLMISVVWTLGLLVYKFYDAIIEKPLYRYAVITFAFLIIASYSYGTYQRNEVWDSEESLWFDATNKSPDNGRGLMNYGLTLMAKGDYNGSLNYFERALVLTPYYPLLHINSAIAYNALGNKDKTEEHYKKALYYDPKSHQSNYYYGSYLHKQNRTHEAIAYLVRSISLSPTYIDARYLLMNIYQELALWDKLNELAKESNDLFPNDKQIEKYLESAISQKNIVETAEEDAIKNPTAEGFLNLSLMYYNEGRYLRCIDACKKAIHIKPNYPEAYNNICSAYNALGKWESAGQAGQKALELKPDYELAKNNLAMSLEMLKVKRKYTKDISPENYLNLSLVYYEKGMYELCIEACNSALKINPEYEEAYNNICSAYNALQEWDKAIEACNSALKIKQDYELARNNLNYAKSMKIK